MTYSISQGKKTEALKGSSQATAFFFFNVLNGTVIKPSSGQVPLLHQDFFSFSQIFLGGLLYLNNILTDACS